MGPEYSTNSNLISEELEKKLLKPQGELSEIRGRLGSMLEESESAEGNILFNAPSSDFPIQANYEIRHVNGHVENLQIGSTRRDTEDAPGYFINYDGLDNIVFVGNNITMISRAEIARGGGVISSSNPNHLRSYLVHPADFDLAFEALKAAESGEILSQEASIYSAK